MYENKVQYLRTSRANIMVIYENKAPSKFGSYLKLDRRRFRLLLNFMKNGKIASPRAVFSLKFHRI